MKAELLNFLTLFLIILLIQNTKGQSVVSADQIIMVTDGVRLVPIDNKVCWGLKWQAKIRTMEFLLSTNFGEDVKTGIINTAPGNLRISDISAVDDKYAWVAMYDTSKPRKPGGIWMTSDGGDNWREQSVAYKNEGSHPALIHFYDQNQGITVGDPVRGYFEIYITTNGGQNWIRIDSTHIPRVIGDETTIGWLYEIIGNTIFFATSKGRILKSDDRGITWTLYSIPESGKSRITDIAYNDPLNGLIKFYDPSESQMCDRYTIAITTNGGSSWEKIKPSNDFFFNDIEAIINEPGRFISVGRKCVDPYRYGASYSKDFGRTWISFDNGFLYPYGQYLKNTLWVSTKEKYKPVYNQQNSEKWGSVASESYDFWIKKQSNTLHLKQKDQDAWEFIKNGDSYIYSREGITMKIDYVNPKLINLNQVTTGSTFGIETTRTSNFRLVKDMTDQLDNPISTLGKYGITFRYTFNFGKIGEDYVPEYTSTYNAGKKFYISGVEIQEKDMRTYTTDGGYNKDVNGYTYVYQLINPTSKVYLVSYNINGNAKYPNIEKAGLFSYDKYKTIDEFMEFNNSNAIILKPKESFKDQVKTGVTKPIDLEFVVQKVEEVNVDWLTGLENALKTSTDIPLIDRYLQDTKAVFWHDKLSATKNNIISSAKANFNTKNISLVHATISPKDDLMFDKDFDSEIIYAIKNNADKRLKITYHVCNGPSLTTILDPMKQFDGTQKIKGFAKESLSIKILLVETP